MNKANDYLLKRETLEFNVDEIYLANLGDKSEEDYFGVRIIPNIESEYFPPFHLRNIFVKPELLQRSFYDAIFANAEIGRRVDSINFSGSVIQGAYYSIPTKNLPNNVFKKEIILNHNTDVFKENIIDNDQLSSISEAANNYIVYDDEIKLICERIERAPQKYLYLYCFYVGQGDSFLMITPKGNVYLIDTNINGNIHLAEFSNEIRRILLHHNLPPDRITTFLITHKHIDHLRGADKFILQGDFIINNFMINLDYQHTTIPVTRLIEAAESKITNHVNVNKKGKILDGNVTLCIANPDIDTSSISNSPDINDSSICLCIRFGNNNIYMTGDASCKTLKAKFYSNNMLGNNILKVSHHGSRTGTDLDSIKLFSPSHAFISCGESLNFKHPHSEAIKLLGPPTDLLVSKKVRKTVRYTIKGNGIESDYF